jgi:hypothetical protein
MGLTDEEREQIFARAAGRCECTMPWCGRHPPGVRCPSPLSPLYWGACPKDSSRAADSLDDYIAMCGACLEETAYFMPGRPM